jgi:large subunit ribosomal protein L29
MRKKELTSLRQKTRIELIGKLVELKKELLEAKNKFFSGQVKDIKKPKNLKHNIAQVRTVIREKEQERQEK